MLFNHGKTAAQADFTAKLPQRASKITEILTGEAVAPSGVSLHLSVGISPESVRVYQVTF
jgi:hypothetical protein